jgi:uncharacterized protein (DUF2147 family)
MMKIVFAFFFCSALMAADIDGYWKSINETTGKPQCVVAVYEYEDLHYGRIVGTFDANGVMTDTIHNPKSRAPGIVGSPFYCGMDLIWGLDDAGSKFKGKIVDPEKGNVYNAELWTDNQDLIVRGKLLFFGRSQRWRPVSASDFPKEFQMPDVSKFVPVIPKVN